MKQETRYKVFPLLLLLILVPVVIAPLFEVTPLSESISLSDGIRSIKYSPLYLDLSLSEQFEVSYYRLYSVDLADVLTLNSMFHSQSYFLSTIEFFESIVLSDAFQALFFKSYPFTNSITLGLSDGFRVYLNPLFSESFFQGEGFRMYENPRVYDGLSFFDEVYSWVSRFITQPRKRPSSDPPNFNRESAEDGEVLSVGEGFSVSVNRVTKVIVGDELDFTDQLVREEDENRVDYLRVGGIVSVILALSVGLYMIKDRIISS